uniref:DUF2428 domain-containing protein n=1 Tax=Panagrolaimus superbus TaxID=310955 RepID=A0A914YPC4_9BILA
MAKEVGSNSTNKYLLEIKKIEEFEELAKNIDSPTMILDKLIRSLEGVENGINNLCETRRSAGLPPLIVAILTTEPKQRNHAAFTNCMERMFAI